MTEALAGWLAATSLWEVAGVVLAIAYLLLAVRQSLWCWYAALGSTLIYLFVFADARLYMESALQLFYMAMAVYGWVQWRHGGPRGTGRQVGLWPAWAHGTAIACVLVLAWLSGWLLTRYTAAELPYVDAFTTWASLVATWMVARKLLENWVYWFVIDAVNIYLYLSRELYLTALLFVAYLVIIVFGFLAWRRDWRREAAAAA
ncbi:MAG: nicotinamide mononucleotide transporter [Gammaproteobacteria bacterium]|nr:nicotinamide mononucleotide transporter [Gammaproteobacteria bacterium]